MIVIHQASLDLLLHRKKIWITIQHQILILKLLILVTVHICLNFWIILGLLVLLEMVSRIDILLLSHLLHVWWRLLLKSLDFKIIKSISYLVLWLVLIPVVRIWFRLEIAGGCCCFRVLEIHFLLFVVALLSELGQIGVDEVVGEAHQDFGLIWDFDISVVNAIVI